MHSSGMSLCAMLLRFVVYAVWPLSGPMRENEQDMTRPPDTQHVMHAPTKLVNLALKGRSTRLLQQAWGIGFIGSH